MKIYSLLLAATLIDAKRGCDPGDLFLHSPTRECIKFKGEFVDRSGNTYVKRGNNCKFQMNCTLSEGRKTHFVKCVCKKRRCFFAIRITERRFVKSIKKFKAFQHWKEVQEGNFDLYIPHGFPYNNKCDIRDNPIEPVDTMSSCDFLAEAGYCTSYETQKRCPKSCNKMCEYKVSYPGGRNV